MKETHTLFCGLGPSKSRFLAMALLASVSVLSRANAADAAAGQALANKGADGVPACATCHGAKGEGMAAAGFPHLAGQGEAYLALQLEDFAKGKRRSPVMEPIAKPLDAQQIADLAQYFSSLPPPFDAAALSRRIDTYPAQGQGSGAWLADRGDWEREIPACVQCHGPGGIGVPPHFPAIAGLPAQYMEDQLKAWKAGTRAPGPLALMGDIAQRMSDEQISAVAAHFAGLPDSPAPEPTNAGGSQ